MFASGIRNPGLWNPDYNSRRGTSGGTQYRNTVRKKWQIPKYRVENRLNTDTTYFNHIYNRFRILMVASILRVQLSQAFMHQGPVARSLVSANRWLRGIKMYRFPWYLTLVSANHASSNPGQMSMFLLMF